MAFQTKVLRTTFLSAAFLTLAAAAPASAQYWGPPAPPPDYAGRIPPQHIDAMVRSMGYQPVAEPRPRGPLWVTHAVDRDGQQVRVLIDGYSGRVVDVLRRPLPPHRVATVPGPNLPPPNGPMSDYEDDGPDYDYRDAPRSRPADWPPSRPRVQRQGPEVIPSEPRSDYRTAPAPKTQTTKKKEPKEKKKDTTASIKPEKENVPAPQSRPANAPKVEAPKADPKKPDAPKADTPKPDAPKAAEVPTFVPNADQKPATAKPKAPAAEVQKNDTPSTPPVQPPF